MNRNALHGEHSKMGVETPFHYLQVRSRFSQADLQENGELEATYPRVSLEYLLF
jgi:hypothetical protein